MKSIKKYFDKDGKECPPEKAVKCHEIKLDDKGKVISEATYFSNLVK